MTAAGAAARATPPDPAAAPGSATGRQNGPVPRQGRAEVVIDVDAAGNTHISNDGTGPSEGSRTERRRPISYRPSAEARRSPFATAGAGGAGKAALRDAGTAAYRSADALVTDYAHRGTFFDLSV